MAELIVCVDKKYGIGKDDKLPWKCKEELALFKQKTMGKIIVMGRKTVENLPKLEGRTIMCLTRNKQERIPTRNVVTYIHSMEEILEIPNWKENIIFAGGASIYKQAIKNGMVKRVYLSQLKNTYECDTWFNGDWLIEFVVSSVELREEFIHYTMEHTSHGEYQYLQLLEKTLSSERRIGRNGSTYSNFFNTITFDINNGYPLLTTKKMFLKGIVEELLFFLCGKTDSKILENKGVNIWKGNTSREFLDSINMSDRREGVMGPIYGYQWRHFGAEYDEVYAKPLEKGIDQLANVINLIKTDPYSRRIIMTTYNPAQVGDCVLPPCHSLIIQFYVTDEVILDMTCYNRSQDLFLGTPFNIASSALLLILVGKLTGKIPRFLHMILGDTHIYDNHIEQVKEQIDRQPYKFPDLIIPNISCLEDLENLSYNDFKLENYYPHDAIKAEMVV